MNELAKSNLEQVLVLLRILRRMLKDSGVDLLEEKVLATAAWKAAREVHNSVNSAATMKKGTWCVHILGHNGNQKKAVDKLMTWYNTLEEAQALLKGGFSHLMCSKEVAQRVAEEMQPEVNAAALDLEDEHIITADSLL